MYDRFTNRTRITEGQVTRILQKLATNVKALETMGKIKEINGYVRVSLDKLPSIRADPVCLHVDDKRQEWSFPQMLEALRKWCDRDPLSSSD